MAKETDILTSTFIKMRSRLKILAGGIAGRAQADDILHDAFSRLWGHHDAIRTEVEACKLSYIAVRNASIDNIRINIRRAEVALDVEMADSCNTRDKADEQRDVYDSVVALAKRHLSELQYEIFELHDIKGYDYDVIAERLGMKPEAVRVSLSRTRKQIRNIYRKYENN